MRKYSYVTLLSNDGYLPGIKGLYYSWKKTNPQYPLCVLVGHFVSEEVISFLLTIDVTVIRLCRKIELEPKIFSRNGSSLNQRWNYTFDKLQVFGLVQYDKLVFLDADMMVLENIDELFTHPHMSATNAGGELIHEWVDLNSGIMVVEPSEKLYNELVKTIPDVCERKEQLGDQDVLQYKYPDWKKHPILNIGEQYNMLSIFADTYVKEFDYSYTPNKRYKKQIKVLHFAGEDKPWVVSYSFFIKIYNSLYYLFCGIDRYPEIIWS